MSSPLFPHTLSHSNFALTQEDEAPFPNETGHEVRTLDGWLDQFFGARGDDFDILFTRLVHAVADAIDCEADEEIVQNFTSDDLDEITRNFSRELLCSIWQSAILMIDNPQAII